MTDKKPTRKEQILQTLAHMLEAEPGGRITTAGLAREVGVSRRPVPAFSQQAKMFEGLISFIEEAFFSRINRITEDGSAAGVEQILALMLAFTERNPGITRLSPVTPLPVKTSACTSVSSSSTTAWRPSSSRYW